MSWLSNRRAKKVIRNAGLEPKALRKELESLAAHATVTRESMANASPRYAQLISTLVAISDGTASETDKRRISIELVGSADIPQREKGILLEHIGLMYPSEN